MRQAAISLLQELLDVFDAKSALTQTSPACQFAISALPALTKTNSSILCVDHVQLASTLQNTACNGASAASQGSTPLILDTPLVSRVIKGITQLLTTRKVTVFPSVFHVLPVTTRMLPTQFSARLVPLVGTPSSMVLSIAPTARFDIFRA